MSADLAEKLAPYGIDYDDALDRFGGNAGLFKRLALKYLDDEHYAGLVAALEVDDFDEAYRQAHTLKGVAGNLSLRELYNAAATVSDELRQGEYAAAEGHLEDLEKAHHQALAGLKVLQEK